MLFKDKIKPHAIGTLTVLLMTICLVFWFFVMAPFVVLKLVPIQSLQSLCSQACVWIAARWVGCNKRIYKLVHRKPVCATTPEGLSPHCSYLVICNHTAWADVIILFDVLHGHMPFGRFFLKKELIWVPIVGLVCWAMDFPFLKRRNAGASKKNSRSVASDLETTRKTCEMYKKNPVALINFLEGTRFTPDKHLKTKSRYVHLLNPKYGGLSTSIQAMGKQFESLINVRMAYTPTHSNLTWSWLCGQQEKLQIEIEAIPIPDEIIEMCASTNTSSKADFKAWVDQIWAGNDLHLMAMKKRT